MNHKRRSLLVRIHVLPPCYHAMAAHPHVTDSDFQCFRSNKTTEMMIRVVFIYRASAISRQWGINFPYPPDMVFFSEGAHGAVWGDRLMHR